MNDKSETQTAIMRINNILEEWEKNKIESRVALELIEPDLKIVISNLERLQDKIDDLKKRKILKEGSFGPW